MLSAALGPFLLAGCALLRGSPASQPPSQPPPPTTQLEAGDDLGGDADFREVTKKVLASDAAGARARLEAFLVHHPHHHQRPVAVAMLAQVMLATGDGSATTSLLADQGALLPAPDRDLLLGLASGELGKSADALVLLRPYLAADPPRMNGLDEVETRARLRLTLSSALAAQGDPASGIDQLELYQQISPAQEAARAFAVQRAEAIARRVPELGALQALGSRHGPLALACLGPKAVAALRARGDEKRAGKLDDDVASVRRQLGLEVSKPWAVAADPLRLGLAVPFSGTQARVGEVVLRGAMLVVTTSPNAQPVPFRLLLRDAAAPPDRSSQGGGPSAAIAELARQERAIGVVSTPDPQSVALANGDGLPLLLLDERATGGGSSAFPILHSSEARAAALARTALALGARRFAILGPDSTAGRRLAAAYKAAVEAGGGSLSGHVTYPATATSFSTEVASLRKLAFDALFIPDDANRLELIAPALAVADLWPRSPRQFSAAARSAAAAGAGRREALLESTALGLSGKFLHNVERYVQGALFCPGFYPADDMRSASFVTRFRETYGAQPSATDAYGYDAVSVLRSAVERGARTRADVLRILATQSFEGLTGDIRFGPDHSRADAPLIYVVDGDAFRAWK